MKGAILYISQKHFPTFFCGGTCNNNDHDCRTKPVTLPLQHIVKMCMCVVALCGNYCSNMHSENGTLCGGKKTSEGLVF